MKKLVLTVALVALLAAAVFGGQAIASSKPADNAVSEETLSSWGGGGSYPGGWGYPVLMKTLSGSAETSNSADLEVILEETYSGVRHVSLTVRTTGKALVDAVLVTAPHPLFVSMVMESIQGNGFESYEFNTDHWFLKYKDVDGDPLEVSYWATITYPSNQW